MSIFVKATLAPKPKTRESQIVAYIYAIILIILVLCQLFTFDDFLLLLGGFGLPGGIMTANMLGSIIVISEVFALPFLLGMWLSPLMRIISMVLGWIVPLVWLKLSLWICLTSITAPNIGFLGTVIDLIPGWWTVFISIALGLLAAWASWGMWPVKPKK